MKIVFAGPSLHKLRWSPSADIDIRGPAKQGDIYRAVDGGANVIALIDGVYENVPAVWHKEILFALSAGVQVFGGASLGALRAAECAAYGMVGIGAIFDAFMNGELEDDAEVALLHGPRELGYLPLSEALVNVRATLAHHVKTGFLTTSESSRLLQSAQAIFFKDRSWRAVLIGAGLPDGRSAAVEAHLARHTINQKAADAKLVLERVQSAEDRRLAPPQWEFARTPLFDLLRHQAPSS